MSRTIRCRGNKASGIAYWTQGFKCAGYYAERVFQYVEGSPFPYREPTEKERFKRFKWLHGESRTANSRSPSRWFRDNRMSQNRVINKQELERWVKNSNYEPMFEENPRSHLWDWS